MFQIKMNNQILAEDLHKPMYQVSLQVGEWQGGGGGGGEGACRCPCPLLLSIYKKITASRHPEGIYAGGGGGGGWGGAQECSCEMSAGWIYNCGLHRMKYACCEPEGGA